MKNFKLLTAVAAGVLATSMANAATDGSLGTTSDGIINASLTINDLVIVDGLADLAITGAAAEVSGTDFVDSVSTVCFFTNSANGFTVDVNTTNDFAFDDTATTPFSIGIDVDSDLTNEVVFSSNATGAFTAATAAFNSFVGGACDPTADGNSIISLIVSQADYYLASDNGVDVVTVTLAPLP